MILPKQLLPRVYSERSFYETKIYIAEEQSFTENGIEKAARSGRLEYKQTIMRGDGFAYKVYPG